MESRTRVTLTENGRPFFDDELYRLLQVAQKSGYIKDAANEMGIPYSRALDDLLYAESVLGCHLTQRAKGGRGRRDRGGYLSEDGLDLMERYAKFRDCARRENARLFQDIFSPDTPAVAAVVMASGMGKRFQREGAPWQNKLLADFQGAPLICRVLNLLDKISLAARTVVTRDPDVAELARSWGLNTVLHSLPHRSDTVRLGTERIEALALRPPAGIMFCMADQPLLRRYTLTNLLKSFQAAPDKIHRLAYDGPEGRIPGPPVIFPARLLEDLKDLPEGNGGSYLIRREPEHVVYVPALNPNELCDADTPEELERLASLPLPEEF